MDQGQRRDDNDLVGLSDCLISALRSRWWSVDDAIMEVRERIGSARGHTGGSRGRGGAPATPREIGAWLHIGADSAVTVYTGKVEIGQNIRTSLTQAVAVQRILKAKFYPRSL